ncbi:nucleotidyltransferase domain-containing protein [Marivirga tractuosa]|uniref:nucleotidyltransferase family protein n=1 Tax=Marivirga tractuosa TaxID=1006 RepID=UPI0035D04049
MTSEQLYSKLTSLKTELKEKYSVEQLAIFGSYAKGMQKPESDIDILVSCVCDRF